MSVLETIRNRRTAHLYRPSQISEETLQQCLETALLAPNHKHTFPWKIIVVGPQTRAILRDRAKQTLIEDREQPPTQAVEQQIDQRLERKFINPAALVVFCCQKSPNNFQQREDYATVCCGIQNFTLACTEQGWANKWSTGRITRSPETYQLLNVDPTQHEIIGFLWVGQPLDKPAPQKRPALEQVVSQMP
ncbi:MAG: nitroreductase [Myxococcota bacterium]